ncbi:winged helix-turn-helix transcriptional regulator [Amycolatopsis saalfeldensis]|uniref:winged helix-turn-helix transcriptional regulator n=1 Tax=Amycolatopsis saalfeldensis TaxID=394193 RepID=UPI001C43472E|nr:helix-turn-helix domain-containing protein [Amycolatopsis saalfeldensis]
MRYTELKKSLEGIATNLLSERLKAMEANGIVERRLGEEGVVYTLTSWGAGLREPMEALGRWGVPLLATGQGDDAFQPRWLTLALPALLRGATASPPVELGIETDGFRMVLRIDETVRAHSCPIGSRPRCSLPLPTWSSVSPRERSVSSRRSPPAGSGAIRTSSEPSSPCRGERRPTAAEASISPAPPAAAGRRRPRRCPRRPSARSNASSGPARRRPPGW